MGRKWSQGTCQPKTFLVKCLAHRRELNDTFVFGRSLQEPALVSTKGSTIGGNENEMFQLDSWTARASSKFHFPGQELRTSPDRLATKFCAYFQLTPISKIACKPLAYIFARKDLLPRHRAAHQRQGFGSTWQ